MRGPNTWFRIGWLMKCGGSFGVSPVRVSGSVWTYLFSISSLLTWISIFIKSTNWIYIYRVVIIWDWARISATLTLVFFTQISDVYYHLWQAWWDVLILFDPHTDRNSQKHLLEHPLDVSLLISVSKPVKTILIFIGKFKCTRQIENTKHRIP
jgi:hypothetical protein